MATPEQLRRQRELNEALREQNNIQRDTLRLTRDYANEARNAAKLVFDNNVQVNATAKAFRDIASFTKDVNDNLDDINKGYKDGNSLLKIQRDLNQRINSLNTEYNQLLSKTINDENLVNKVLEGQVSYRDALISIGNTNIDNNLNLAQIYTSQSETLKTQLNTLRKTKKQVEEINKAMTLFGKVGLVDITDGITRGLQKSGFGGLADKLGFKEATDRARRFAAYLTRGGRTANFGTRMKVASMFGKSLFTNLTKALGPATIITKLISGFVDAFKTIDKRSGETAKNLGISYKEALKLDRAMTQAAHTSGDMLLNSEDLVKAQNSLNKAFGTSVQFSNELAISFGKIQKRLQLSERAMTFFAAQSMVNNTTMEDQLNSVAGITQELNFANNITLNQKELQEAIAETSNANLLSQGRTTKEIANQVFQSKLLGVKMAQIEGISSNLLQFESSIAAEMEAELLTGKQLNLERARQAALNNDIATVAKEIRREVGSAAEFGAMNLIQQEAFAKAVGMTREELASALVEQENLLSIQNAFGNSIKNMSEAQAEYNKLRKSGLSAEEAAKRIGDANLANQMESLSTQERLAEITKKLGDLFIAILEPIMPLVDGLLSLINVLEPFMGTIVGALSGFVVSGFNPVGALVGGVLGAGSDAYRKSTVGLATGGIVTKPTTALIGEGGEPEAVVPLSRSQQFGFGSSQRTEQLLERLVTAVEQGGDVYIDGAKVGKSIALATSKMG